MLTVVDIACKGFSDGVARRLCLGVAHILAIDGTGTLLLPDPLLTSRIFTGVTRRFRGRISRFWDGYPRGAMNIVAFTVFQQLDAADWRKPDSCVMRLPSFDKF